MSVEFETAFAALKSVLAKHTRNLAVKANTGVEYTLATKSASPFPQHKARPLDFGSVRMGKAYVSFHLMALYMNSTLTSGISPALKKRMQGKTCFNFKVAPESAVLAELERLTEAGFKLFKDQKWL